MRNINHIAASIEASLICEMAYSKAIDQLKAGLIDQPAAVHQLRTAYRESVERAYQLLDGAKRQEAA